MAFTEHEENVSQFYSRIVDTEHNWNEGFLTFGIWETKSGDPIPPPLCYKTMYDELLEGSMIQADHNVLEVACGQGAGMMRVKSKYGCNIQGLDISDGNVKLAKRRLRDTGIAVTRGSGTNMPYDDSSFDSVICIEGGPHFKTREDFFQEAFRVLKPGGKLFMADDVLLKPLQSYSFPMQMLIKLLGLLWVLYPENMSYGIDDYIPKLTKHGFTTSKFEAIGNRVIPGYCNHNLKLSVMREQAKIRGELCWISGGAIDRHHP